MLSMTLINRCIRILHIARKPTAKEMDEILKITGLGFLVVGFFGMAMYVIFSFI
jgi:protein translocase SEC61 complex gamma subunit